MRQPVEASPVGATLVEQLREAYDGGDGAGLRDALAAAPAPDPIGVLLHDRHLAAQILDEAGFGSLRDWLVSVKGWQDQLHRPSTPPNAATTVLHAVWRAFELDLTKAVARARRNSYIPSDGWILCFVDGIYECAVVHYTIPHEQAALEVIAVISAPLAAFDIFSSVETADALARNALKKAISDSHRLVYHRGVLAHVDRREDRTVFGPSIDTVLMSEILAQQVYEMPKASSGVSAVLEIGSGSGLLIAGAARHLPNPSALTAIDLDIGAVVCTRKNVQLNQVVAGQRLIFTNAAFEADLLGFTHDLVICNPPYIPEPPTSVVGSSSRDYFLAVSGLTLMLDVVRSLDRLLTPKGRLLLMVNNMAVDDALAATPRGFRSTRAFGDAGFEVSFEVEAVLTRPAWLAHVRSQGWIDGDERGFRHTLHPLWFERVTP